VKRSTTRIAIPSDYADRVKALRAKHDLTQMRLADLLGVSYPTISRWESGQVLPFPDVWKQIARIEQFGLAASPNGPARSAGLREAPNSYLPSAARLVAPDFMADPEAVRLAVEAHRLEYGYLVNPTFATEIALIEPLPVPSLSLTDVSTPIASKQRTAAMKEA
jgi:transcriptional regulator with XRE-family HTH domain